jgi:hypothetical protein
MSRKQYIPHGSSHEKKISRKERREQAKNNPMMQSPQEPMMVSAPTESDKRQLRNLTIIGVVSLVIILGLMYYMTAYGSGN